jgi:aryl-alcohol dehydrogenase-like predicted oxidoreductase
MRMCRRDLAIDPQGEVGDGDVLMSSIRVVPFGRTGLTVSRLGLGLAALGRPGYINLGHADDLGRDYDVAAMRDRAAAVLDAAWEAGVRYCDAARSYGRAEEFLASWLDRRGIAADAVTIGSKWGYTYTAEWRTDAERHEVKEHSYAALARQIAESRAVLGRHLDLYQIHSATLESGVLEDARVLERLAGLRGEGLAIGLSLSGPRQAETLRRAMAVRVGGGPVFDTVQATWNLLETSAGPALHEAHDAGMGVIVKEALANGRLTVRNGAPEFVAQRRLLEREAERLSCSLDALALAAVLAQPWVDVVLSGAATVEQLRSNVAAVSVAFDGVAGETLASICEDPAEYWNTRARLVWN